MDHFACMIKDGWGLLLDTLKLSTAVILPRQQISAFKIWSQINFQRDFTTAACSSLYHAAMRSLSGRCVLRTRVCSQLCYPLTVLWVILPFILFSDFGYLIYRIMSWENDCLGKIGERWALCSFWLGSLILWFLWGIVWTSMFPSSTVIKTWIGLNPELWPRSQHTLCSSWLSTRNRVESGLVC